MVRSLIFLFLCSAQLVSAAVWEGESLIRQYFHHSETQRQWAWSALGRAHLTGSERVLDFGCGDGKVTAELAHLVDEIIGVDVSYDMIHFASRKFPAVQYIQLDDFNFGAPDLGGQFDLIFALTSILHVPDPVLTLCNLAGAMRPGGQLIFTVPMRANLAVMQAFREIAEEVGMPLPVPSRGSVLRTTEGCRATLEEAGWKILEIEEVSLPTHYVDREEFVEWLMGTFSAVITELPTNRGRQLFSDFVERYIQIAPEMISDEGVIIMPSRRIEVVATPL